MPLGASLHVAVVTARPPAPLAPGIVYGYDLGFRRQAGDPGDDGPAEADLGSLGLLGQLGYRPGHLPSFALPPARPGPDLRVFHGSCRKPHGESLDAMADERRDLVRKDSANANPSARTNFS